MQRCPNCGHESPDNARKCALCRTPLGKSGGDAGDTSGPRLCPHCREPVAPDAQACRNCGLWLDGKPSPRRPAGRRRIPVWLIVVLVALAAFVGAAGATWLAQRIPLSPEETIVQPQETAEPGVTARPEQEPGVAPDDEAPAATATAEPVVEPTATEKPQATSTPTAAATATPSPEPTEAPTSTPTPEPTTEPSPTPAPEGIVASALAGNLAFPVFDPARASYDIYMARPDGSDLKKVMDEASQPELSPDGQRIAFRRWRHDDRGIEVMDLDGANRKRLSSFLEDAMPSWSPSGETLVFFSRRQSDRRSRVYQVNVIGGDREMRRDAGPVLGEYPAWSRDGTIVYRDRSSQITLARMNADGSNLQTLLSDGSAIAPSISPDGQSIAVMSKKDGNWEIYSLRIDGSGLKRLTTHDASDGLPAWSPDGKVIAFVSDRDDEWAMWAVTVEELEPVRLFALPGTPHGIVAGEPDYSSAGWYEERVSWGR